MGENADDKIHPLSTVNEELKMYLMLLSSGYVVCKETDEVLN